MTKVKGRYKFLSNKKFFANSKVAAQSSTSVSHRSLAKHHDSKLKNHDLMEEMASVDPSTASFDACSSSATLNDVDMQPPTIYINRCLGFNTIGNEIPNQLIGKWCLNLKETDQIIQSLLPVGTFGKTVIINLYFHVH